MRLRVAAVRLGVDTAVAPAGRTVRLKPGFNVIRAANSRGKSQIAQAIVYGLGMERMLNARANAPLGSALTSEVIFSGQHAEEAVPVSSSWVVVVLENDRGDRLTVQRFVKSAYRQPNLVRVWEGDAIEDPSLRPTDYFLHQAGSASHGLGFHRLLVDFIGWSLPEVPTFAGKEIPLYPDVVFPYMIADQQSWGSASPRKVDRYQIRNPLRRAAEFLLGMNGPADEANRARAENEIAALIGSWEAACTSIDTAAAAIGARVVGIPRRPAGATARAAVPAATVVAEYSVQVMHEGEWTAVRSVVEGIREELRAAGAAKEAPAVRDEFQRHELETARSELRDLLSAAILLEDDVSTAEAQLVAIDRRIDALREERERNSDVRTLMRLGSATAAGHLADHNCPTCRQSLDAVEAIDAVSVLGVDETVNLLNAQIRSAERMRERAAAVNSEAAGAYSALQREADQLRVRIRALEADSEARPGSPSSAAIARRVMLELRDAEIQRALEAIEANVRELGPIARAVVEKRAAVVASGSGENRDDVVRIEQLSLAVRQRLLASRFGSYAVSEMQIDRDALRPSRQGFDVDTDVSASDVVRIKIAYLDAVRRIGADLGRHPGLLVLDEPRQQDIDAMDFARILGYLAEPLAGGQVIVTSATRGDELDVILRDVDAHIVDLGDRRVVQPEGASDPLVSGLL